MAVFFASLLPQFIPAGESTIWAPLTLGLVFALMTFTWLASYAVVIPRPESRAALGVGPAKLIRMFQRRPDHPRLARRPCIYRTPGMSSRPRRTPL